MTKIELIATRLPWLRNVVSVCQFVALLSLLLGPFIKAEASGVDWLFFAIAIPMTVFALLWEYFTRVVSTRPTQESQQ
ncbi:hypothetical protein F753_04185 [Stutzerimonas chloritidismutans AW-1]|uniref:Uncharacterized protein n=1 Tax=Stutzerimonas chloritidismutans AW-1 TaxID=1263865 RepID=V4QLG2_STUCH|nr:hypothetical protein [Stutzerimonas chloritidismutans]ESR00704.1 hypothetical protein F753_04185 [Stutzerimonas chloritidismutans AW-1]